MKNLFNLQDDKGRIINETPLKGTKEQAEAYAQLYYDNPKIKAVPVSCIELNELKFTRQDETTFFCYNNESTLFDFRINSDTVLIYEGEELVDEVSIKYFLMFPQFIELLYS